MNTNKDKNGSEGAENLSTQNKTGIQTPDNGSYQQSRYIAAISEYLGWQGLVSSVTDTRDGVEYSFDFYHPETKQLFKVFHEFDEQTYRLYRQYSMIAYLIYDLPDSPCLADRCRCGRSDLLEINDEMQEHLREDQQARIYYQGKIWECFMTWDGRYEWRNALPKSLVGVIEQDGDWDWGSEGDED